MKGSKKRSWWLLTSQGSPLGTDWDDVMCWLFSGAHCTYLYITALNYVLTECQLWLMGLQIYFSSHSPGWKNGRPPTVWCLTVQRHKTLWPGDQITVLWVRIIIGILTLSLLCLSLNWVNFQHVLGDVFVWTDWTSLRFSHRSSQRSLGKLL